MRLRPMARHWIVLGTFLMVTVGGGERDVGAAGQRGQLGGSGGSVSVERALLNQYCVACHNERSKVAGLTLDIVDVDRVGEDPALWEKVVRKVRSGAMPPVGRPRPEPGEFRDWIARIEGALDRHAEANPNAGRPTIHRLNRAEYTNAVRDLLALEIDGRSYLPADDSGYGFDNIADVLSVSPGLMERYMLAASKISRAAVGDPGLRPVTTTYKNSPVLLQDQRLSDELPFGSRGGMAITHHFPLDGDYVVKVDLERPSGLGDGVNDPQQLEVRLDRVRVKLFELERKQSAGAYGATGEPLEVRLSVKAGTRLVGVSFVGSQERLLPIDGRPPRPPVATYDFQQYPIDPAVYNVEIVGPFGGLTPADTPSRRRIFLCSPSSQTENKACAEHIIGRLARRAYRRPVTDTEVETLMRAYLEGEAKGGFEVGIRWALETILASPKFLFRLERDPANIVPNAPYRITDLDLASRLSFFLWSSIPDSELLELAIAGRLSRPTVLREQVARMLADPRSSALIDNFAGQWLFLRNMRTVAPNSNLFPDFDDNLREALRTETELFLQHQLARDNSLVEMMTANYSFLNERLARHYGIPDVYGSHFRRVTFPDDRRAGLLGQGSILTVTSYPNRTSPVVRGKWLLENLLGAPPPPPPPDVPALKENDEGGQPTTVRDRLEQHRANPVCATCHAQMDPLGFALENFDAVGRWRTIDADTQTPIDASGVLSDGSAFETPVEFRALLLKNHEQEFIRTVTEKLLTYALGRGLEFYDMPTVRKIMKDAEPTNYRWSSIIHGIIESLPFRMRTSAELAASGGSDSTTLARR